MHKLKTILIVSAISLCYGMVPFVYEIKVVGKVACSNRERNSILTIPTNISIAIMSADSTKWTKHDGLRYPITERGTYDVTYKYEDGLKGKFDSLIIRVRIREDFLKDIKVTTKDLRRTDDNKYIVPIILVECSDGK